MILEFKKVFVLAPHADDAEFGCGGLIARLFESGSIVYSLVFSAAEERKKEMIRASSILGIKKAFMFNLPIRNLGKYRQKILDKLIEMKKTFKPDLVLQPSLNDIHQDHQVIAEEGVRAFKNTNLWAYEVLANNLTFDFQLFITINEGQVEKKIKAIQCYQSQNHRNYLDGNFIRSLARVRGVQIGADYAESFGVIREIL